MAPLEVILTAGGWAALSLLLTIAASLALLRVLPCLPWGRRLVLEQEVSMAEHDFPPERQQPSREGAAILAQGRQPWGVFRGGLILGLVALVVALIFC